MWLYHRRRIVSNIAFAFCTPAIKLIQTNQILQRQVCYDFFHSGRSYNGQINSCLTCKNNPITLKPIPYIAKTSYSSSTPHFSSDSTQYATDAIEHSACDSKQQNRIFDAPKNVIPRAAVSSCIRCSVLEHKIDQQDKYDIIQDFYLLVQRGKEPNKGIWSFPGGKLEFGESTMDGAIRELIEEVKIVATTATSSDELSSTFNNSQNWDELLHWYKDPVMTSDSIGGEYHYLIAQCYGEIKIDLLSLPSVTKISTALTTSDASETHEDISYKKFLPKLLACDDAMDAKWFTKIEIKQMTENKTATPGIIQVVDRVEELSYAGLLPVSIQLRQ